MATLVLGAAIGGSIGGAILGVSAATIGGFIGSTIGSVVDSWIISSLAPTQRIEGARMDNLRITSANRIPQLSFEVFRPLADPDTAEGLTQAVSMIPASGEFAYATQGIRKGGGGSSEPENLNALTDTADMVVALDRLQAMAPKVESVSLVVAWFGDDLRAGNCKVRPGVEVTAKSTTSSTWSVNGVSRANAFLVSCDDQNRPVYGGTPADFAVVQAIQEMKARGLKVTFYPFILMDVPPDNALPNPYSDNATEVGQPAFAEADLGLPWNWRIGPASRSVSDETYVAASFNPVGVGLRPFSVAHVEQPWRKPRAT